MSRALKLHEMLSSYQDGVYSIEELEELEVDCYIPRWIEKATISCSVGNQPLLYFWDGLAKIKAPNGRVALALMMIHGSCLSECRGLTPSRESTRSLSEKLRMYEGILSFGTQEQQNAMWEAYCYLFSYAKAETDIDKFHLHCIESKGFIFRPSYSLDSSRHFPKPGEQVKLVRLESKVRHHGWMTPEMFRMAETGQLCRSWQKDGFDAKHWFLLSWLEAYGICHKTIAIENGIEYLEKEITVPEDTDEFFCDGEQYVERISR